MGKDETQDFRITRLENEVDFFRKTTEQSLVENGKKMDKVLNILESDESVGKKGLVKQVDDLEKRLMTFSNFIRAYKLAIAMLAGLFTTIGGIIGWYFNLKK